jgi:geranylgeranyl reductase family protein
VTSAADPHRADVAVIGGGPAGAAAAITLARAGRDVVVVDRARFPRDKCCGDGLTAGALRQLEGLGVRPEAVASWQPVDDVWVRSPSGRTIDFPLPRGRGVFAAVARRVDLDATLLDVARAAGAKVLDGHALEGAAGHGDHVRLDVTGVDGGITARYVVGADGMWSPLRRAIGAIEPGYLGEWHAFRQYFADVAPPAARDLWVWFEPDLLPGYAWSFPLPGNRANVGFGVHRDRELPTGYLKSLWPELLARPHVAEVLGPAARPEAPHKAWPIPARIDRAVLSGLGGRALFAGDAAGATDPMTGEGIAQALIGGRLAAQAILATGPTRPARAAAHYRRATDRALLADHRMSTLLTRALRHRAGARGAVRVVGATAWSRRQFARWLFEDEPRAAIVTPRRWHRAFLGRDGAFATDPRVS